MALGFPTAVRNTVLDAITTYAGGSCLLKIFSGTRPATGGTETTKLAQLTCNATFAPAASSGVLTLNSISSDTSADATGTASWFRINRSDGTTVVMDGAVTATGGGGDMTLDDVNIVLGGTVAVTSATITAPNA